MTEGLAVPAAELGVVRVFALDRADPVLVAILPPHPVDGGHLAPLLGLARIDDEDVERITIKDLGDMALSDLLAIGHDIRAEDLEPARARLDAATGQVLLIHSRAFGGQAAQLAPAPGLHFLGAFRRMDAPPAPLTLAPAPRDEALPPPPATAAPQGSRGWAMAVLFLALFLLGLALFAGLRG